MDIWAVSMEITVKEATQKYLWAGGALGAPSVTAPL